MFEIELNWFLEGQRVLDLVPLLLLVSIFLHKYFCEGCI